MDKILLYLFHFKESCYGETIIFAESYTLALEKFNPDEDFSVKRYNIEDVLQIEPCSGNSFNIQVKQF